MKRMHIAVGIFYVVLVSGLIWTGWYARGHLHKSAMSDALTLRDDETIRKLIKLSPTPLIAASEHGFTVLHYAAMQGDLTLAKACIDASADVNVANSLGDTPLHEAAGGGHGEVAKLLIAQGANVNAIDKEGNTPLHEAARWGHLDMAAVLMENGADVNITITCDLFMEPEELRAMKELFRKYGATEKSLRKWKPE